MIKISSLAALKVVKMTTSSAASDENFVKMTTFSFQCLELYVTETSTGACDPITDYTELFRLHNCMRVEHLGY